jgi:hypothetical protein
VSELATQPGPGSSSSSHGAPAAVGSTPAAAGADACPLCGGPLEAEQEWCLSCGAAARTRLAATPGWRGPIVAIVAVIALSLGVLAAALIDLAGGSGPTRTQVTRTVTSPAAATPAPVSPTATPTTPAATVTPTTPARAPTSTLPGLTRTGATRTAPARTKATPPIYHVPGGGSLIPGVQQPGAPAQPK